MKLNKEKIEKLAFQLLISALLSAFFMLIIVLWLWGILPKWFMYPIYGLWVGIAAILGIISFFMSETPPSQEPTRNTNNQPSPKSLFYRTINILSRLFAKTINRIKINNSVNNIKYIPKNTDNSKYSGEQTYHGDNLAQELTNSKRNQKEASDGKEKPDKKM